MPFTNALKTGIGSQLTYEQVLLVVRTMRALNQAAGERLPTARRALAEIGQRLMRKPPVRSLMAAHKGVTSNLAKLALNGVRRVFEEERR